jgi:hypothetical protein
MGRTPKESRPMKRRSPQTMANKLRRAMKVARRKTANMESPPNTSRHARRKARRGGRPPLNPVFVPNVKNIIDSSLPVL